jgi:hypothetical protein
MRILYFALHCVGFPMSFSLLTLFQKDFCDVTIVQYCIILIEIAIQLHATPFLFTNVYVEKISAMSSVYILTLNDTFNCNYLIAMPIKQSPHRIKCNNLMKRLYIEKS